MLRTALSGLALLALTGCIGAPAGSPISPPSVAGLTPDAQGLQPNGTELRIDFGRAQVGVIETVSRILRDDPSGITTNSECGAGAVTAASWSNGLTLNFLDGDFDGWTVDEPGLPVSGRLQVGGALPNRPLQSTSLGTEFDQNGIFGLSLDGQSIEILWSGVTCFFR